MIKREHQNCNSQGVTITVEFSLDCLDENETNLKEAGFVWKHFTLKNINEILFLILILNNITCEYFLH